MAVPVDPVPVFSIESQEAIAKRKRAEFCEKVRRRIEGGLVAYIEREFGVRLSPEKDAHDADGKEEGGAVGVAIQRADPAEESEWRALMKPMFTEKQLVVFSADYHVAPISDIKNLLGPLGVRFIDRSLSTGHCNLVSLTL